MMSSTTNHNQNLGVLYVDGSLKDTIKIIITTNNSHVHCYTYIHLFQSCIYKKALSKHKKIRSNNNDNEHAFSTYPLNTN